MTTTIFTNRDVRERLGGNGGHTVRLALIAAAAVMAMVIITSIVRVTRIGAGYVGVEVNLAGSQRGAQEIPIRTGWVFYSPLKTQIIASILKTAKMTLYRFIS